MRSSELAALAGVTVRTLRHYHQLGLLDEPPRSSGGYRHYDVGHLVRVLRITRLTGLGVPLTAIPSVLDDPEAAAQLLDELDRQATDEIERLTARRAGIADLRRTGGPPDLPPDLVALRSVSTPPGAMARLEHEQLLLIGHLFGEADHTELAELTALAALLGAGEPVMTPLTARFYALDEGHSVDDQATLVDDLVAVLAPIAARLHALLPLDRRATALFDELNTRHLRPVQHQVLRRVEQRLAQGATPLGCDVPPVERA